MRSHRWNPVVRNPAAGPAGRNGGPRFTHIERHRRLRWWFRTGALFSVIGVRWLARTAWTRRRSALLVTGTLLMVIGVLWPSGLALVPGTLVLILGLVTGNGACECGAAAQLAGARWRG